MILAAGSSIAYQDVWVVQAKAAVSDTECIPRRGQKWRLVIVPRIIPRHRLPSTRSSQNTQTETIAVQTEHAWLTKNISSGPLRTHKFGKPAHYTEVPHTVMSASAISTSPRHHNRPTQAQLYRRSSLLYTLSCRSSTKPVDIGISIIALHTEEAATKDASYQIGEEVPRIQAGGDL